MAMVAICVIAFIPNLSSVRAKLPLMITVVCGVYLITVFGYFAYISTKWQFPFLRLLLGGESLNIYSAIRIGWFLVIAALVLGILEMRAASGRTSIKRVRENNSAFAKFLATLFDPKMENFISRKVSGYLYFITAILIVLSGVIIELASLREVLQGNLAYLLVMLLTPIAALVSLVVVRMAFEAGVALIVIAENTKK